MKLKIGKNTTRELASWFGISYDTFRHKKVEKLNELSLYCCYELVYGGIIVKTIYIEEYIKPTSKYNFIRDNLDKHWHKSGYDTVARVASEIYYAYKDNELKDLKISTIKNYVCKARIELYGRVHRDECGTEGSCYSAPVRENKWEEAELLTKEEYQLYLECRRTVYYDEEAAELEIAYMNGQLTQAEFESIRKMHEEEWDELKKERFFTLKEMCIERMGFCPDIVTKLEKKIYFEK